MLTFAEPLGTDGMALAVTDVKVAGPGSGCETIGSVVRGGCFRFLYLPDIFENAFISLDSQGVACEFDGKKLLVT